MYRLEIRTPSGWRPLAEYEELWDVHPACDRAMMSEKCSARVVEVVGGWIENVVYERHYNIRLDPDENWRDEFKENYDEIRWQEAGF